MDAAGAFLSVNSLQRLPAGIMGVALKRARERRRSETPLESEIKQAEFSFSFLSFFSYCTCGTSATCICSLWGTECPLTLKLSGAAWPRVVQGRYAADEL